MPCLRGWVGKEVKVNSHPKTRFRLSLGTPHTCRMDSQITTEEKLLHILLPG